jgi:ABC-type nitrate/sulfonate/bicarbonate transport system substrate-binding protein
VDIAIVMGGDNGFNRIIAQSDIKSYAICAARRRRRCAEYTFALLLYKVLKDNGSTKATSAVKPVGGTPVRLTPMKDKTNAAGILAPPFAFSAVQAGLKDMGSAAKAVGTYQSDGAFVLREWAKANSDTLTRYIKAYVEGRRWVLNPANKAEAIQLLVDRLRLAPDVAAQTYAVATDPADGIAKDAKFDMEGFKNVLKLRAEIEGQWGGNPPPPDKYLDLTTTKALAGLPAFGSRTRLAVHDLQRLELAGDGKIIVV